MFGKTVIDMGFIIVLILVGLVLIFAEIKEDLRVRALSGLWL